jgi:phosphoesterase RecJ-like protein
MPKNLAFLGMGDVLPSSVLLESSLFIAVDTAKQDRLAYNRLAEAAKTIKIDHHIDNDQYADINWVKQDYAATSLMIAELAESFKNELKMTKFAAIPLYLGIISDTQRFRVSYINKKLFSLVSTLVQYDINYEEMYSNFYTKTETYFDFKVKMLSEYKKTKNGVIYIYFPKRIITKYELTDKDIQAFVDELNSIKGFYIWIIFSDMNDGSIRVSIRSRYFPIHDLAVKYQGGGHLYASGAKLTDEREMKEFLDEADNLIKEFKEKCVSDKKVLPL